MGVAVGFFLVMVRDRLPSFGDKQAVIIDSSRYCSCIVLLLQKFRLVLVASLAGVASVHATPC